MMLSRCVWGTLLLALHTAAAVAPDENDNCEKWALLGECEANPGYMLVSCATSCNLASKSKEGIKKEIEHIGSFFDLKANDIDGNEVDFSQFKGHLTILTNVASYCGRTESHYKGLVDLWRRVTAMDLPVRVLAFPCNQFGQQEPGTAAEIKNFAKSKGVEFTMMEKIDVNGPNASMVYKYLKYHTDIDMIRWNFDTYFVVDHEGEIREYSEVEPYQLLETVFKYVHPEL